jgi:hypothetical protein
MFFGPMEPSNEEEFVYNVFGALRDLALKNGRSVILDSTAPKNSTRDFLLNTRVEGVVRLVVLMLVEKNELAGRNQARGMKGVLDAWDKVWENPSLSMPVMKFRNNSIGEFETSYYVLQDLLKSKVNPYRRRFLGHIYPRI